MSLNAKCPTGSDLPVSEQSKKYTEMIRIVNTDIWLKYPIQLSHIVLLNEDLMKAIWYAPPFIVNELVKRNIATVRSDVLPFSYGE